MRYFGWESSIGKLLNNYIRFALFHGRVVFNDMLTRNLQDVQTVSFPEILDYVYYYCSSLCTLISSCIFIEQGKGVLGSY